MSPLRSFLRTFVIAFCLCCAAFCLLELLLLADRETLREPMRQYRLYLRVMPPLSLLLSLAVAGAGTLLGRRERQELQRLRRTSAQQARTIDELEGAAERREEFIGGVAHELKTPLTAIIGYADLIRSSDMAPRQRFTAAGYIFSEGRRLEALSKKLMDIIVLGHMEAELRPVDAAWFLREVAAVAAPSTGGDGLHLQLYWDKAEVRLEPDLFKTLLLNLVDNARKASRPGQNIRLYGKREEGGYAFYVSDSGRGMAREELDKITEAFYMIDKSRARKSGGAGLGLALCQRIAELHGTKLEFSSEPGRGTTVRVFLKGGTDGAQA